MRGGAARAADRPDQTGRIPADAGEPYSRRPETLWRRVYPRAHGGSRAEVESGRPPWGLSPSTRGAPDAERSRAGPGGYPRARGGTSRKRVRDLPEVGLSPRTRGERTRDLAVTGRSGSVAGQAGARAVDMNWSTGLSPRAGDRIGVGHRARDPGSIPAHAGERVSRSRENFRVGFIPRA